MTGYSAVGLVALLARENFEFLPTSGRRMGTGRNTNIFDFWRTNNEPFTRVEERDMWKKINKWLPMVKSRSFGWRCFNG